MFSEEQPQMPPVRDLYAGLECDALLRAETNPFLDAFPVREIEAEEDRGGWLLSEPDALEREPKGRRLTSEDLKAFSSWTESRQHKEAMELQALTGNNQRFYVPKALEIKSERSHDTKTPAGVWAMCQETKKRTYSQFNEHNDTTSHSAGPALKLGDF